MRAVCLAFLVLFVTSFATAQVATGGAFTLEKSVIAGGGGDASGGAFEVTSTKGQAATGGPKTGSPFSIYLGFWTPDETPIPTGPCPFGQGYWKNNPATWPVDTLILGDETYTKTQLLAVLNMPAGNGKKTDASLILAYQLIAAKLNVANGVDAGPLGTAISDADTLLAPYNGKLPNKVMSSTGTGQNMVSVALLLESFNKGLLTLGCAPPPVL